MLPAHRKGDIGSGHGRHLPPSSAAGGSPDANIYGIPAMRVGDADAVRGCAAGHAPRQGRALSAGSTPVFINGKAADRIGDGICGSATTGSSAIYICDKTGSAGRGTASTKPLHEKCNADPAS